MWLLVSLRPLHILESCYIQQDIYAMSEQSEPARYEKLGWLDILGLLFLAGLAVLPPFTEIHKQLILLAIGIFQIFERRLISWRPARSPILSVLIKIFFATLLLDHTGEIAINSAYWPIYFLPVVTAATYFGPVATLGWTAFASLAYCSYLIPARAEYDIAPESYELLGIRILFFFLAAILVNRFVTENRRQVARYQSLSETLAESNRQLQRAQADARRAERLAALGQLSAGLAHEIRNPLGIIKGAAEMLHQKFGSSQPAAAELSAYISTEVNRLNALVSRFLDFARPSHLDLKVVDISVLLDRAIGVAQHRYPEFPVSIERHVTPNLPSIFADEQMCDQIFANLVLNAYEAMGAGNTEHSAAPRISISISSDSSNGVSGVAVEIQDSGPGVPDELREQIFNPFVSSKKTGVGLGLSIVAKIVDDHRGSIQLISGPGTGACFRIFLPAAAA
jgi:two-component system, NtrC family, sensor histidine kinase HydH